LKATFERKVSDAGYTFAHGFPSESQLLQNRTSSIPVNFLSHTESCDWPVRNTWRYSLEFRGHYTVCVLNKRCCYL